MHAMMGIKATTKYFSYYEKYFKTVTDAVITNVTIDHDDLFRCHLYGGDTGSCKEIQYRERRHNNEQYTLTYECLDKDKF